MSVKYVISDTNGGAPDIDNTGANLIKIKESTLVDFGTDGRAPWKKATPVTQSTSITTAVTSNGVSGKITTFATTLGPGLTATFTVNNTSCKATSFAFCQLVSNTGAFPLNGIPLLEASNFQDGSFDITIANVGAVTQAFTGAMVIHYLLI